MMSLNDRFGWWVLASGMALAASVTCALEKEVSLVTGQPIGELAVAGRLSVDLHAEFMVSREYGTETVLNWYTCGYSGGGQGGSDKRLGGAFGDFGFQVPFADRQKRYPHAVTIGKIRAVRFDGGDFMKGNFAVEKKILDGGKMAVETWFRSEKPEKDDVIVGWQSRDGKETSAWIGLPAKCAGSEQWRHLVVNCTPDTEVWYLDGEKIASGKRRTLLKEGHIMVLGGASSGKPSFKGDLVAVRLHDEAMTPEEIAHNFKGGPMLGTEMHNWWRNEPGKWWSQESDHFRHAIDKAEMSRWDERRRKEFNDRVPGMFNLAELIYHTYSERLALRSSVVSKRPEKRGDGIKYKIPIQPAQGSWMGVDDDFGWACQGEGHINPHELVHGWDAQTGNMQGNFWEAHANFPQTYNGIYQTMPPGCVSRVTSCCPVNGRDYYNDRLMFEHLAQTPEYGPMFVSKLWYDGPTATQDSPYPWITFTRLNPYPERTLADEYTRMAMRNVTWDYLTFEDARGGSGNTGYGNDHVISKENLYKRDADGSRSMIQRCSRVVLEQIPYAPEWWRVPKEFAPQQLGWNICPLSFKPGKVSATLAGYVNPKRGSDWRAGFVGVDQAGKAVYGDVFGPGKQQAFTVADTIRELYLVVCGTPTNIMPINMTGDFRSFEQEPFPYRVKLQGCEPIVVLKPERPNVPGKAHANGGGFVADSAKVEATAYVAPGAQVLGNSTVSGRARIEDCAVVEGATVTDEAVVSGYASVGGGATIAEQAKVRDCAEVSDRSVIKGHARILEHALITTRGNTCTDEVTVKGVAHVYGGNQKGSALIDGFYAKGNEITGGRWFTWSWGQGKNPGESGEDFGGLYADYDFETEHLWMAADAFGATWGYLVGSPRCELCPDKVAKKNTLRQPESVLKTLDREQHDDNNYSELLITYLRPRETGEYTFWIAADDEGELWIDGKKICSNPFWAGFRDYGRFPSQKSAPIRLERGKAYALKALHSNAHMGGALSVSWAKAGAAPAPIPADCLSLNADGNKPGVLQRVWGDVRSVADLVSRPDYPEGVLRVGGSALALNGKDQFVELPKDVADFRSCSYSVEFKQTMKNNGSRLFEFSQANGDALWLSPWEDGKLVFGICQGKKTECLTAPGIPLGLWARVQVCLDGKTAALFVNGRKVAENKAATLSPDCVRATRCYLGRGEKGGYFGGLIDRMTIFSRPLQPEPLQSDLAGKANNKQK